MTPDELLRTCTWDQYDFANITVVSALFGGPVQVRFLPEFDSGRVITVRIVAVLNDFLTLSPDELLTVKQLLWADCQDDFENINYGFGPDTGEPELVVNQREFDIYSAEDAYAQSNLTCVSIPEEPTARHRYGSINFEPAWAGHGCSVIMKDGQLIAMYSNDWHFKYEDDEEARAFREEGHFLTESPRHWKLYQPCYLLTGMVPFAGLIFFIFSWLRG